MSEERARGEWAPPQPLPRGANVMLVVISLGTLVGLMAFMAWLMLG